MSRFEQLKQLYIKTEYYCPELDASIFIGQVSAELDRFMREQDHRTFCFITGWNRFSKEQPRAENDAQNELLRKDLQGFTVYEGHGALEEWVEQSFLVFDLSEEQVTELLRKYEQNAAVYGTRTEPARLLFHPDIQPR